MNIPLSLQEASLLYSGANGQQASPFDPYELEFPKAIESEIDLVDVLHHLSKLLSLHQPDVSQSGPDMIERRERERRDMERVPELFASPFNCYCFIQPNTSFSPQQMNKNLTKQKLLYRAFAFFLFFLIFFLCS